MPTTRASTTIPMPDRRFPTVRALFSEMGMSDRDFRIFTGNVRLNTMKHLDDSGLVSVEEQDPAALRHFLDQVKKSDPTIAKRYPYFWPVLAYLELYLNGKYRTHIFRHRGDVPLRSTRRKVLSGGPIWIRFARSVKTGKSLQEISEIEPNKYGEPRTTPKPRVSRSTPRRTNRQRPVEKDNFKKEPRPTVTVVDESITQPVDSGSASAVSNGITTPVGYFLRSFGSSVGSICAHFVRG